MNIRTEVAAPALEHGNITEITALQAGSVWSWIFDGSAAPDWAPTDLRWLHATFDDGLIWGEFRDGTWNLPTVSHGKHLPDLRRDAVWELRLFGPSAEILVWPADDDPEPGAQLVGRILSDGPETSTPNLAEADEHGHERSLSALKNPLDSSLLLFGNELIDDPANGSGFSLVGDVTGAKQVVPLDLTDDMFDKGRWWPATLLVRHYLQSDPATDALRIAASRFVHLRVTPPPEEN